MRCRSCEKPKVSCRKGLWSPEEDQKLRDCILQHGRGCWSSIPAKAGLQRNGKSCRLRWINYLRPGLKRGIFTTEEEEIVMSLHSKLGNKWSQIALHLPGRTDNEIKNYWNSYLKKKVIKLDQQVPKDSSNQGLKFESFQLQPSNEINISATQLTQESSPGDQSGQSPSRSFNKGSFRSSFPKVLFAEWLSRDHHDGQNAPSLDYQNELNSSWETLRPGETAVDGLANGGFAHGFEERGIFEDLQCLNSVTGYADLLSMGNEIMGDDDMIYDAMY